MENKFCLTEVQKLESFIRLSFELCSGFCIVDGIWRILFIYFFCEGINVSVCLYEV